MTDFPRKGRSFARAASIVSHFESLIKSGDLKPGDKLPTARQMAFQFETSAEMTVMVRKLLAEKNLVRIVTDGNPHHRGTFVL